MVSYNSGIGKREDLVKLFFALTSHEYLRGTVPALSTIAEPSPKALDFLVSYAMFSKIGYGWGGLASRDNTPYSVEASNYLKLCQRYGYNEGSLLLDSGAFSCFTLGVKLKLSEYSLWIRQQRGDTVPWVKFYSALDVIGDADLTWRNLKIMEKDGLKPRPVIHYGYTDKQIVRVVDEYNTFSIGGVVPLLRGSQRGELYRFLDHVVSKAVKRWSTPVIHGFGISVPSILVRYPFDSVDSSSWLAGARYARVSLWDDNTHKFAAYSLADAAQVNNCPGVAESYGLTVRTIRELFAGDRRKLRSHIAALGLVSYWRMSQYVNTVWKSKTGGNHGSE